MINNIQNGYDYNVDKKNKSITYTVKSGESLSCFLKEFAKEQNYQSSDNKITAEEWSKVINVLKERQNISNINKLTVGQKITFSDDVMQNVMSAMGMSLSKQSNIKRSEKLQEAQKKDKNIDSLQNNIAKIIDWTKQNSSKDKENVEIIDSSAWSKKLDLSFIINPFREVQKINNMTDDAAKVIEFNKIHSKSNYIIVDKENFTATVYTPEGKPISSYEVALGEQVGDNFNDGFGLAGKPMRTTTPGEYQIQRPLDSHAAANSQNYREYGKNVFNFGKSGNIKTSINSQLALHQIPASLIGERAPKLKDGNLANNRMSYGCVNLLKDDFEKLAPLVNNGSKVYILPEEKDNSLKLRLTENGQLKFEQTKYKQES